MQTILVIGSNSFTGSNFCNFALENKFRVIGISRSDEIDSVFLKYKTNKRLSNFSFLKLDIDSQQNRLFDVFDEYQPEYVVNFAAQGMVEESWSNPSQWYQTNFVSLSNIVNYLKDKQYLKKFLNASTPEIYGNVSGKLNEDLPSLPSTPYALSKAAFDMHLKIYKDRFDFPYSLTRSANVFGPGQQIYRIIPKVIMHILLKKKIPLHGGGIVKRSFIHIDDVVEATYKAMKSKETGDIYHVSTEEMISIQDLVLKICTIMDYNINDLVESSNYRSKQDLLYELDSNKAKKVLNWSPKIELESGILTVVDWTVKNFSKLSRFPTKYIHKS